MRGEELVGALLPFISKWCRKNGSYPCWNNI